MQLNQRSLLCSELYPGTLKTHQPSLLPWAVLIKKTKCGCILYCNLLLGIFFLFACLKNTTPFCRHQAWKTSMPPRQLLLTKWVTRKRMLYLQPYCHLISRVYDRAPTTVIAKWVTQEQEESSPDTEGGSWKAASHAEPFLLPGGLNWVNFHIFERVKAKLSSFNFKLFGFGTVDSDAPHVMMCINTCDVCSAYKWKAL